MILGLMASGLLMAGPSDLAGKRVLTDMSGRGIEVPADISRIACIGRGSLRMVAYLHAADRVVGVEYPERKKTAHVRPYLAAYPRLKTLPSIGHGAAGDPELLLKVAPQVIFYADGDLSAVETLQAKTGIPIVHVHCGNLTNKRSDFNTCLLLMAYILNKQSRCDSLIAFIDDELAEISRMDQELNLSQYTAYVGGLIFKGQHGITSTEANYAPFQLLGMRNVATEIDRGITLPVQISMEQLLLWNPDVLVVDKACADRVAEEFNQYPLLKKMKAFQSKRIFEVLPSRLYGENFETTLLNCHIIANCLGNTSFDFREKANEIYSMFLTADVADAMLQVYGDSCIFSVD